MSQQRIATNDPDQLVTGEAVVLELPAASLALRIVSGLIDLAAEILLLILGLVLALPLVDDAALAAVVSVVTVALAWVIAPATLETLTHGRTLGKLATGMRTVRDDAGPISFHHAFVRHLVAIGEVWLFSGVPAFFSALVSSKGKRLGDFLAGTYVVRTRVPLLLPRPVTMPPYLAEWAARADIAPLPDALAITLRQAVTRVDTLTPVARQRLVDDLARRLWPLVSPPPPPGTHPEAFLAAVAAERRRRDEHRLWREGELRRRLSSRP